MTKARRTLVSLSDTPYYHCVSRCVRRAFLCGDDRYSGRDYSHRRAWVKERLALLSQVFAVEICAYAVMSNHYHLVVHVDQARAETWSDAEVVERWRRLFKGPLVVQRFLANESLNAAELRDMSRLVAEWRGRLADIGWYMRCLNEHIARRANAEDGCTGRFWQGRFKCQALLDAAALITAMAYVDLNPVRAGLATGLMDSADTSVQQRLSEIAQAPRATTQSIPLKAFAGMERNQGPGGIPFNAQDYLDLVDWTGRAVHADKRGAIDLDALSILELLGIDTLEWLPTVTALQTRFELVIGSPVRLRRAAAANGRRFYRGYRMAVRFYRSELVG